MRDSATRYIIFIAELAVVYAGLGFVYIQRWIYPELFFLLIAFSCLIFCLYYGVRGAGASILLSIILLSLVLEENILTLLTSHYLEASFLMAGLFITGFVKTGMDKKMAGTELGSQIVNQRLDRLTVELSEKDKALQDAFREVLTDMDSPRIMYQTLRRLEYIDDRETLFSEILFILYTHCHVEKSVVYEFKKGNRFTRVSSFGATSLPEVLKWKAKKMPEIMRVATAEREVVIPTRFNNRFVMAVPLMSTSGNLLYIILIEEIRFINLNEALINLLKASAFWIKNVLENHFHREEFLPFSVFSSVIVYRPEHCKAFLSRSIANHKKFGLPYACIQIKGDLNEENCKKLSSMLRIHDEFFMVSKDTIVILLTMIIKDNVPFVVKRLNDSFPEMEIHRLSKKQINAGK